MRSNATVTVVGGGPAGCHFAIGLARAGVRVTILERAATTAGWRVGEWLSPEGKNELVRAALWERLPADVISPCETSCSIWSSEAPALSSFLTHPHGCAWHLDRVRFDAWLIDEARRAGVPFVAGAHVRSIDRRAGGFALDVDLAVGGASSRTRMLSDFVVDASGRSGRIGRALHDGATRWDSLCAVVAATTAAIDPAEAGIAIEAAPSGWWYSARLPNRTTIAAFFTDPDFVPKKIHVEDRAMEALLDAAPLTRARVPRPEVLGVVSAATRSCDRIAGERWLAIGDAALARDPLSGDGIASALRTATAAQAAFFGWSCGDPEALARYDAAGARMRERYFDARAAAYGMQHRFGELPFWQRRTGSRSCATPRRCGSAASGSWPAATLPGT